MGVSSSTVDLDGDVDVDDFAQRLTSPCEDSPEDTPVLSFQKWDVYLCAIEFLALAFRIVNKLPRGHGGIAEQFRRASLSIPLNVAEGAGRMTRPDAARHYGIARGSAMECAAILDAMALLEIVDTAERAAALELIERIVSMLTKLSG
jgi:four helix bundle protein